MPVVSIWADPGGGALSERMTRWVSLDRQGRSARHLGKLNDQRGVVNGISTSVSPSSQVFPIIAVE